MMNLRDLDIDYDRDLIKRVSFKKGQSVRPLWSVIENLPPDQMIIWVDRMDSLCPISCEWALAQALEKSCGIILPKRAQFVRTVFAEINRLVYLTTYLGGIVEAAGIPIAQQKILMLRELVFQMQEELMGGRVLPQVLKLGGVKRDLAIGDVQKVAQFISTWKKSWAEWLALVENDEILLSRLEGLLRLPLSDIRGKGLWGILGKAAQNIYDARLHQPHGAYSYIDLNLNFSFPLTSDALSRYQVALNEVKISLHALDELLKNIPQDSGAESATIEGILKSGFYSASTESARGPVTAVIEVDKSGKLRTARLFNVSQRIWPGIENYFVGLKAEDFNLAWASLGISGEESEV